MHPTFSNHFQSPRSACTVACSVSRATWPGGIAAPATNAILEEMPRGKNRLMALAPMRLKKLPHSPRSASGVERAEELRKKKW